MTAKGRRITAPAWAMIDARVACAITLVSACVIGCVVLAIEPGASLAWIACAIALGVGSAAAIAYTSARAEGHAIREGALRVDALAAVEEPARALAACDLEIERAGRAAADRVLASELGARIRRVASRMQETATASASALRMAEQETKGKMQFFGAISHDLRGPLASIVGFSDLLCVDDALGAEQRQSAQQVRSGATALLALVDDLLDAARLEAGRIVLRPRWTPPFELWSDAMLTIHGPPRSRGVRVEVEMEAGLAPAWVDPARSRQALGMLVAALVPSLEMGKLVLRASVVRDATLVPAAVRARSPGTRFMQIDLDDRKSARDGALHAQIVATLRGALDGEKPEGSLGLRLSLAVALVGMQGGWIACTRRDDGSHVVSVALPLSDPFAATTSDDADRRAT